MIENYEWYEPTDTPLFINEYEKLLKHMLCGKGFLSCAVQTYYQLHDVAYAQGCGITREGLACDWHGRLYPCHRAVERGPEFAIGDIFNGLDRSLEQNLRHRIDKETFGSDSSKQYSLTSFCPVAIYQKHKDFSSEWSDGFCEMIEAKAMLMAKYFHDLCRILEENKLHDARACHQILQFCT